MLINDLPPEILGLIFVEANMTMQVVHTDPRLYVVRRNHKWGPLNFVHVCRYWREIALSMQTLWSSFEATDFNPNALRHWLSFSRTSPVHLAYWPRDGLERGKPVEEKILKNCEETLRQYPLYADRWSSLYFRSQNVEITEVIANMLDTAASRSPLQKFEIHMIHDDTPPKVIDTLVSAISSFQSLRHLHWTFNSVPTPLPRILPWHNLQDVYVCSSSEAEDLMWCLTQCTSARNVTLLGIGREKKRRGINEFQNLRCTLPILESLTLNENCDPDWFLHHFTLPSLLSFEIRTSYGPSNRLQDFLDRCQPPLEIFRLKFYRMKKDDVVGYLSTPYLRSVREVSAMLPCIDSGPYLAEIVEMHPDILKQLPRLRAGYDRNIRNYIGWRSDHRGNVGVADDPISCLYKDNS